MYNPENKETYYYVDEYNMVLTKGNDTSYRDSIGRNFDAYIAWKDKRFIEGVIDSLFSFPTMQRHPAYETNDISRDHISYALILFYISGYHTEFYKLIDKLKWRISSIHTMRGMYLFVKSFRSRIFRTLFYIVKFPEMLIYRAWNYVIGKIVRIKPERTYDQWYPEIVNNKTAIQTKASNLIFPVYALHNFAWQLNIMPQTKVNRLLKRLCLPMAGKTNYVIKCLLNGNIDHDDISRYGSMTGGRWTTILNEFCRRTVTKLDPQDNELDKDFLNGTINL